jgi:hypothetical protein
VVEAIRRMRPLLFPDGAVTTAPPGGGLVAVLPRGDPAEPWIELAGRLGPLVTAMPGWQLSCRGAGGALVLTPAPGPGEPGLLAMATRRPGTPIALLEAAGRQATGHDEGAGRGPGPGETTGVGRQPGVTPYVGTTLADGARALVADLPATGPAPARALTEPSGAVVLYCAVPAALAGLESLIGEAYRVAADAAATPGGLGPVEWVALSSGPRRVVGRAAGGAPGGRAAMLVAGTDGTSPGRLLREVRETAGRLASLA